MTKTNSEVAIAYEFNGETGEHLTRELTPEELAQNRLDAADAVEQQNARDAKAAARASALAKLADLGLTAEEIAAL
jgi:hypothetical protein